MPCDHQQQLQQSATADPLLATLLGDDVRWFEWSPEGRLRCTLSQHEFPIRAEHVAGLVVARSQGESVLVESRDCDLSQPHQSQQQLSQDAWSQQQWRTVRQHVRSKAFAAAAAVTEALERASPHIVACTQDSARLQCRLTGSTIARTAAAISRHTAGHRFQSALARLEPQKAAAQRLEQWQESIAAQQRALPEGTSVAAVADERHAAHSPLFSQHAMASLQSQHAMASLQSHASQLAAESLQSHVLRKPLHSHAMHGHLPAMHGHPPAMRASMGDGNGDGGLKHAHGMDEDQPMDDDDLSDPSVQKRIAVASVGPRVNAPRHKKRCV
ncbi:hypothetical protein CLOM_g1236 [Closterium sp. NIES-68]|nr:hypothetical protein CLOM_g1236 [Closterium sp. NIES-68]GJP67234.1 hypothetical protein CLOP_g24079 [Closterium sp. NIES-67]